ncbi:prenyltransferase/squalene oxidase repeat-containing protein [Tepidibacter thalassicus]|uniref:Prenyltransferase and squalene oxidase repeat-containing protein n=1 Tax=Tepidibacter thalassicus DSM 15285 TaxID=1123350 RepID=A0A1M5R9L5_9FIRM|nr:prenyltransferase/squalene oxidase repeat-containing protein [Tepidibacter thalassicus]SHH23032.1 hypothetical protein SAMN02744040_01293 [Tepidibacter thalassicus DSM 15285]
MKKRLLSLLLIFAMVLSFTPVFDFNVYADSDIHTVRVRVEGKDKTLFDKEVTVTDEVYGIDILKKAVGEENIEGTDGEYGFLIEGIFGEKGENKEGYSTSWGLYVGKDGELESSPVGISTLALKGVDELLLHIKAVDASWNDLTCIPKLEVAEDGNKLTVKKIVVKYDENWKPIKSEEKVEGATLEIEGKKYTTDKNGEVEISLEPGKHIVKVSKKGKNYPELIRRSFEIKVGKEISESETDEQKIEKEVECLRDYYLNDKKFSFEEAMGYNYTSKNIEKDLDLIQSKFKVRENLSSATDYAANIIGLIASGINPTNFKGQNYVKELVKLQKENGIFEVKNEGMYPTTTAWSIIALDMANADYDVEKSVKALLNQQKSNGSFGTINSIDNTAMCIMALGNHKNISGVEESIDKAVKYIKSQQTDNAAFKVSGSENPYTTAAVIQGLIAVGEDPLSQYWIKNGKTMFDFLLSYKKGNHFEVKSEYGTDIDFITQKVFVALADLYKGKSMYQRISIDDTKFYEEADYDFELIRKETSSFKKGREAQLNVKVKNSTNVDKKVTYIVALYKLNGNNKELYTYTFMTKTINAGATEEFAGGFLIPNSGEFEVKGMLWDNFDNKTPLAKEIKVDVE